MRHGVGLDKAREQIDAGPAQVRAGGVHAEHHAQPLRLLVDGVEARVAQEVAAVGGEHGAGEPQLPHRAAQLDGGGLGVQHGQERHRPQTRE